MQKLQLYISNVNTNTTLINYQRVDLFKDENVSISLSIQNIRRPDKIFTEFTKTFTIPASKTNNLLFEHYYNFNITDGFDARDKREAKIELNNIPYKDGFIALNGVELKNNKPYSYKITFYGKTINLNKQFRDASLNSLQSTLTSYNLDYINANIISKMAANIGDVIIAPLITHTTEAYYDSTQSANNGNLYPTGTNGLLWSELKYAIKVSEIVNAIQTTYGLEFSTDFFGDTSNTAFNNLYLWLNAKKGNVQPTTQINTFVNQVSGFVDAAGYTNVETEMSGTSGLLISPFNIPNRFTLSIITTAATVAEYTVRILDTSFNTVIFTSQNLTASATFTQANFTLSSGTFVIEIIGESPISFSSFIWNVKDLSSTVGGGWENEYLVPNPPGFNFATEFEFIIGAQMPDIKLIDFMNGLFKLFNLTAYYDNQPLTNTGSTNPNYDKIRIQTLDSYYAEGRGAASNTVPWDISKYVDTNKSTVNVGLPYNSITFSYEGLETFYAQQFLQTTGGKWGGIRYEGIGTTDQGSSFTAPNIPYNITTPFEHLQLVRLYNKGASSPLNLMTGFFANDNKESLVGKPLLFYAIKLSPSDSATQIRIKRVENASTFDDLTTYIIPSNSLMLNPDVTSGGSTVNINFQQENNEWTDTSEFSGTLFENYYKTYIQQAFNSKRRIIKLKAFLPLNIIYNIQMNDQLSINNVLYQINNANINLITGETKFELLNIV